MSIYSKFFNSGKSEIIDRYPRYEYFKHSNLILIDEKLDITVKNISLSGVLIEFLNKDRELLKKKLKKNNSCRIAVPYMNVLIPEQITIARVDRFCGSIICGCRFDENNSDNEIVKKRERLMLSLMKNKN